LNYTTNHIKSKNELIYKARDFAFNAHASQNQKYGDYPYSKHLSDVVLHLISYGFDSYNYLVTGLLHDVLEVCPNITHLEIQNHFGIDILNNVIALTKLPNGEPNYVLLNKFPVAKAVKLADSTCNLGQGLLEKNSKSAKYIKRFPTYLKELRIEGEYNELWIAMEKRISIYKSLVLIS
jgi:(p)ppGpp synthase/HD superfamily hydrolase